MSEEIAPPSSGVIRASFGSSVHAGRGDLSQAGRDLIHNVYGMSGEPLPVPRQLPPRASNFVDRVHQLSALNAVLCAPDDSTSKAVALVGGAGVGKTALALQWAHDSRQIYPDGDLYVNLRGYDVERPADPSEVLDGFLRAFNIAPERIPANLAGREGVYRALLATRRVLIVLDNAATAGQVRPLLPGSGSCHVLITSRSRLAGLLIRDGVTPLSLEVLSPEGACLLLVRLLGPRATDDIAGTAELARLCAYLPLALRIAAERARLQAHLEIADIVVELRTSNDRLGLLAVDEEDELASVRGVFSWSYQRLRPTAADMFRLLGLHSGLDISAACAAALAGSSVVETQRRLDFLLSAHLVDPVGSGRYQLHDLLKAYAMECAVHDIRPEDCRTAVRRELLWYLQAANHADHVLAPQRRHVPVDTVEDVWSASPFNGWTEAVQWCEAERTNYVAMVQRASDDGYHDIAWKLPLALNTFFHLRWYIADWQETASIGLASARLLEDPFATAWSLTGLGGAYEEALKWTVALQHYEEALSLWSVCGDQWGEMLGVHNISNVYREVGRLDESVEFGRAALNLARQVGNARLVGQTLQSLGRTYGRMRKDDEATACFQLALEAHREAKEGQSEGRSLYLLADLHRIRGQEVEAFARYREALDIQRSIGDRRGEGHTLLSLARMELTAGHRAEARTALRAARDIFAVLNEMLLRNEVDGLLRIVER